MFHKFRERFGTAGLVVSVVALVFALAGGAFAASGGLNAKQKKQVKAIAKSFQGTGPAGAPGLAGLAGAKGDKGDKGDTGDIGGTGADGKSVSGIAATVGECPDGGVKYTLDGVPTNVCNGADGPDGKTVLNGTVDPTTQGVNGDFYIRTDTSQIWGPKAAGSWSGTGPTSLKGTTGFTDTLPPTKTEKGVWAFTETNAIAGAMFAPISFNIPLAAALAPANVKFVPVAGGDATCTGNATAPTAPSGFLCVYASAPLSNATFSGILKPSFSGGAGISGALVSFGVTGAGATSGTGSWAVTAAP